MKKPLLKFTVFKLKEDVFNVFNHEDVELGFVTRERVGRFMHWVFYPHSSNTFFTAGCLDELRAFMKNPIKYFEQRSKK